MPSMPSPALTSPHLTSPHLYRCLTPDELNELLAGQSSICPSDRRTPATSTARPPPPKWPGSGPCWAAWPSLSWRRCWHSSPAAARCRQASAGQAALLLLPCALEHCGCYKKT